MDYKHLEQFCRRKKKQETWLFIFTVNTPNSNALKDYVEELYTLKGNTLIRQLCQEKKKPKQKYLPTMKMFSSPDGFSSHVFVLYITHTVSVRVGKTIIFCTYSYLCACFLPVTVQI